jgi:signal transduction histidine kinase
MTNSQNHDSNMTSVTSSLSEIAAAVMAATRNGKPQQVLQEIAHTARKLANARYAALGIPNGHGGFEHFLVSGLNEEDFARIPHPPVGRGLLGVILREHTTLRIEEISHDARKSGFPPNHPRMHSLLGVPIEIGNMNFGSLYLSDKIDGTPFTEDDQRLVETLAGYAALTIAGVQLSEKQSRLSTLEERERIAMELHDSIIQLLYAVGMELQLLKTDLERPETLVGPIKHLDEVIGEIRRYILNLKSAESRRFTILQGLRNTLDRLHAPSNLKIGLDAPDEYPPFDTPTFDTICQICTEVASNTIRHANATELGVRAYRSNGDFVLDMADNGTGFDLQDVSPGLGLMNIRRRAQLHSGMVELYSNRDSGTRVRVTLPIR